MIGKIMKNDSFRATLKYLLGKDGASHIGGNLASTNRDEMAREFEITCSLKRIKKPVYHVSLSLPHHETLSDEQFSELAEKYITRMGFDPNGNQYCVIRHCDRTHGHIHLVANRVNVISSAVVDTKHDYYRSQAIIRELELEYHLTSVESSWDVGRKSPNPNAVETLLQNDQGYVKLQLQNEIDHALADPKTLSDFAIALMDRGISIRIKRSKDTDDILGLSYQVNGIAIAGGNLGSQYSYRGLKRRGLSYIPIQDDLKLQQVMQQLHNVQILYPVLQKTWDMLKALKTPQIVGKAFILHAENASFTIQRRADEMSLLTLFQKPGRAPAEFTLQDLKLTEQDYSELLQAKPKLEAISQLFSLMASNQGQQSNRQTVVKALMEL